MSLRLFIDQCVSEDIISILRNTDHEVLVLRDYISIESLDDVVIAKAQELDAILVSLNGDFADIVTYPPANYKGIISLQLKNRIEVIPQLMERLIRYLSLNSNMEHYQGKLLLAEVYRIRIRE